MPGQDYGLQLGQGRRPADKLLGLGSATGAVSIAAILASPDAAWPDRGRPLGTALRLLVGDRYATLERSVDGSGLTEECRRGALQYTPPERDPRRPAARACQHSPWWVSTGTVPLAHPMMAATQPTDPGP